MRVQAVSRLLNGGHRTCDICASFGKCIRNELTMDGADVAGGIIPAVHICHRCLDKGIIAQTTTERRIQNYSKTDRRRTNKIAKKSEAKTAQETGGRCTGYLPSSGDSRNSRFMFEDKTRVGGDKKSYRLTEEVILKGRDQAIRAGLTPVFRIHLKSVSIGAMLWDDLIDVVVEPSDET